MLSVWCCVVTSLSCFLVSALLEIYLLPVICIICNLFCSSPAISVFVSSSSLIFSVSLINCCNIFFQFSSQLLDWFYDSLTCRFHLLHFFVCFNFLYYQFLAYLLQACLLWDLFHQCLSFYVSHRTWTVPTTLRCCFSLPW